MSCVHWHLGWEYSRGETFCSLVGSIHVGGVLRMTNRGGGREEGNSMTVRFS